ncbi:MAG: hypothetical protein RBR77_02845 [Thauera sp.]|nr:hypothetical protein [Thauera sp.]
MLSIRDMLDYCDISDEQVALLAEHEGITDAAAAHMVCGMVQSAAGVLVLTRYMLDLVERAQLRGDPRHAAQAEDVCRRFMAAHPVSPTLH